MSNMQDRYLEITFRKGKAVAAYLYLARKTGQKATCSKKYKEGIIIDFKDKNVIGMEITSPSQISISEIISILHQLNISPVSEQELAP